VAGEASQAPELLETARELVKQLECGDSERAAALLDEITHMRETDLFRELGRLTRTLHDALNSFSLDDRLVKLAEYEIPDARERLRYVVTKTEQAAHRTLEAVEDSMPLAKELEKKAREHKTHWERFLRREMDVTEFRSLTHSLGSFLDGVMADAASLHRNLSEVLMAQDYQDLTGQVIDRVIHLVEEMEKSLVHVIRVTGSRMQPQKKESDEAPTALEGPQIKAEGRTDVVSNQDEVDKLLASLGF
jgi:chemotaxis protein CheZ